MATEVPSTGIIVCEIYKNFPITFVKDRPLTTVVTDHSTSGAYTQFNDRTTTLLVAQHKCSKSQLVLWSQGSYKPGLVFAISIGH